ncbi:MAG TPA: hypothetical protein VFG65_07930 [Fimbriimonadales bacterium]|jgi:hypothetical protein|nr:hypothetical protein [Fimbriimonadales bacterium]
MPNEPQHGSTPMSDGPAAPKLGYEPKDFLSKKALFYFGLSHFAGLAAVLVVVYLIYAFFLGTGPKFPKSPLANDITDTAVAPVLQSNPGADIKKLHIADAGRLDEYGWVDKDAGIAHIPIEKAIDIAVAKGLPARGQTK